MRSASTFLIYSTVKLPSAALIFKTTPLQCNKEPLESQPKLFLFSDVFFTFM